MKKPIWKSLPHVSTEGTTVSYSSSQMFAKTSALHYPTILYWFMAGSTRPSASRSSLVTSQGPTWPQAATVLAIFSQIDLTQQTNPWHHNHSCQSQNDSCISKGLYPITSKYTYPEFKRGCLTLPWGQTRGKSQHAGFFVSKINLLSAIADRVSFGYLEPSKDPLATRLKYPSLMAFFWV